MSESGQIRRLEEEGPRRRTIGIELQPCAGSIAARGALSRLLFGVSPFDPLTLMSVVGVVLLVATLAALIPAARAAFVQPMRTLREE